jgi:hypothetical protein
MMNKKRGVVIMVALLIAVAWGVRVYQVNDGVAKKYDIQTYRIGESIPLEHAQLTITRFTYGNVENKDGFQTVPATLEMTVKNTSDQTISVARLIEAKLAYDMDYIQTMEGSYDAQKIRQLPPHARVDITLVFDVAPKFKGKKAKLYLDQTLYKSRVIRASHQGKRYGIAVDL